MRHLLDDYTLYWIDCFNGLRPKYEVTLPATLKSKIAWLSITCRWPSWWSSVIIKERLGGAS